MVLSYALLCTLPIFCNIFLLSERLLRNVDFVRCLHQFVTLLRYVAFFYRNGLGMTERSLNTNPTYKTFIFDNEWHIRIVGFFIGMIMIAIYCWMATGFVNLLLNLYHSYPDWTHGAEKMIKDVVIILALFELIRVFQAYLSMGRIKVTFILDVALVVLIGELISLWYREYSMNEVFMSVFVISVLIVLRIVTTKFSPDSSEA